MSLTRIPSDRDFKFDLDTFISRATKRMASSDVWRAAWISARTIHALLLREAVTRYGRRSAGYAWDLFQPMLQLTAMLAVFGFVGRAPPIGDSLVVFFITGIMPVMSLRQSITRGARAINSNRALMNYPQVRAFEIITARILLEMLTNILVVLLIVLFMKAFFDLAFTAWISAPLELLGALGTLYLLCYGTGFLSAQIGRLFTPWADLMAAVARLLFFTSGIWYTLETLPTSLRQIVMYNPLAQVIEWIRDAAIRGFESQHFNPIYPIAFAVVCLFLGLVLEWFYRITGLDLERR